MRWQETKGVVSSNMFVEEGGVKAGERLWESLVRKNLAVKTKTGFEMVKQKAEEKIELATYHKSNQTDEATVRGWNDERRNC